MNKHLIITSLNYKYYYKFIYILKQLCKLMFKLFKVCPQEQVIRQ
ncbi:unnamed protein product, partial [marine sediment metagenome]